MSAREPRSWVARADGWVGGRWVRAGERVRLTPLQATREPVDPAPAPAPVAPKRPTRRRAPK